MEIETVIIRYLLIPEKEGRERDRDEALHMSVMIYFFSKQKKRSEENKAKC